MTGKQFINVFLPMSTKTYVRFRGHSYKRMLECWKFGSLNMFNKAYVNFRIDMRTRNGDVLMLSLYVNRIIQSLKEAMILTNFKYANYFILSGRILQ